MTEELFNLCCWLIGKQIEKGSSAYCYKDDNSALHLLEYGDAIEELADIREQTILEQD